MPERMPSASHTTGWTRIPIASVEDLSDAVLGAGLEVTQMSRAPVRASLAFATLDGGITCSTGYIGGRIAFTGPLSANMVTLGVGLVMGPGTRHWLNEAPTGAAGVFLPGDEHDSLYTPGSLYAVVTLSSERLEEIAAQHDLVLDAKTLGGTGIDAKKRFSDPDIARLRMRFERIHAGHLADASNARMVGMQLLDSLIAHFARVPGFQIGGIDPRGLARIVARARAFIHANLDHPLSVDKIANAAATSQRTLHRAFQIVLDETPYSYVQKLRLHRIRHELVTDAELACTIASVAHRWNIPQLGRLAAWYRDLFGELPSQTLARRHHNPRPHELVTRPHEADGSLAASAIAVWQHPNRPPSDAAVSSSRELSGARA
jgi:AraC-like DNA-binding protein